MFRGRRRFLLIPVAVLIIFIVAVAIRRAGREDESASVSEPQATATAAPGQTPTAGQTPAPVEGGVQVAKVTTLVDDVGGRVDWSEDGDTIAFSKRGSDGNADIFTMNPDGSDQTCLTCDNPDVPQLSNDQPAWHPSGDWIIFQAQDPDLDLPPRFQLAEDYLTQGGVGINNNLWLVNPDGSKFHQLTEIKDGEATLHAHFSHDGKKLLWGALARPPGGTARWVLNVADFSFDGGDPQLTNVREYRPNATNSATFYESHGFTPDDTQIIFSASIGRSSPFDMDEWLMDLDTEELTQLTDSPGVWDEHGQISPDGGDVLWISSQGYEANLTASWARTLKTDFWLMNIDGSDKRRLTFFNEPGHEEHNSGERVIAADSSWSPDGDKFVASLGVISGLRSGARIVVIELTEPV